MANKKLEFQNANGDKLSAVLDLPLDQHPIAYAVFAHCFTCSKNLNAVKYISKALTENGFGVLSFDFTGLGQSEGDFANTNFSSNIQDLQVAIDYLATNYKAPKLLVGHSLGGAAVLFATQKTPSIQAVATIGAPFGPSHVSHLMQDSLEEIKSTGIANVMLGGRPFTIKKQFLDDISEQNTTKVVQNLDASLLILHSPQDDTVDIENATKIYKTAQHPKSFVSLDGADHLLSNKDDIDYVGRLIANWSSRYVDIKKEKKLRTNKQVLVSIGNEGFTTDILAGHHTLKADEPASVGGNDFGPSPYDLLLASLGACTAMTLRMYADRKGWAVEEINVHLSHDKDYFKDNSACENNLAKIDIATRSIEIKSDLNEEQRMRMLEIADKCPVHRSLENRFKIKTELI